MEIYPLPLKIIACVLEMFNPSKNNQFQASLPRRFVENFERSNVRRGRLAPIEEILKLGSSNKKGSLGDSAGIFHEIFGIGTGVKICRL
jgi:hypothetical protein